MYKIPPTRLRTALLSQSQLEQIVSFKNQDPKLFKNMFTYRVITGILLLGLCACSFSDRYLLVKEIRYHIPNKKPSTDLPYTEGRKNYFSSCRNLLLLMVAADSCLVC